MTPPITSPRSDASPIIPEDEYKIDAVSPQSSMCGQDIIDKVDSVATKALHVFAGVVIAAMTAFIASHGIIATAAMLGIGFIAVNLMDSTYRNSIFDPTSSLSGSKKVEHLVKVRLWAETIKAAVCLGSGTALMHAGFTSLLGGTHTITILKGAALIIGGKLITLAGCEIFIHSSALKLVAKDVDDKIKTLDSIKAEPSEIQKLLFTVDEMKGSWNITGAVRKITAFMQDNPIYDLCKMSNYLQLLQHSEFAYACLFKLIDNNPASDLLTLIKTEDVLREYLDLGMIEKHLKSRRADNNYTIKGIRDFPALKEMLSARLRRLQNATLPEGSTLNIGNIRQEAENLFNQFFKTFDPSATFSLDNVD